MDLLLFSLLWKAPFIETINIMLLLLLLLLLDIEHLLKMNFKSKISKKDQFMIFICYGCRTRSISASVGSDTNKYDASFSIVFFLLFLLCTMASAAMVMATARTISLLSFCIIQSRSQASHRSQSTGYTPPPFSFSLFDSSLLTIARAYQNRSEKETKKNII